MSRLNNKGEKIKIVGYSERGLLNSLFYEMRSSPNSLKTINDLVSLISFPFLDINFSITDITVLIEQSFSDFGDADAVLLIDNKGLKQSIFIEAKVKTSQQNFWSIEDEFSSFNDEITKFYKRTTENKLSSSNLFTQLYRKLRFYNAMKADGIDLLKRGVNFPKCSSKEIRKIGENKVVLRAVEKVSQYCDDAFFVSLVPDSVSKVRPFYKDILRDALPKELNEWDVTNWGFIIWKDVEEFSKDNNLKGTQEIFEFNRGQIY